MKIARIPLVVTLILMIIPYWAFGQMNTQGRKVKKAGSANNGDIAVLMLDNDNPDHEPIYDVFEDISQTSTKSNSVLQNLPRFAMIGKDHKYYLAVGGYIKGTASFDIGNPIQSGSNFTTSQIVKASPGNGAMYNMSAQTSNFYVTAAALPHSRYRVGAYLNFNLDDDLEYNFNLINAYLTFMGFKLGFGYTMFNDGAACPNTIDWEGPSSLTSVSNTLLNYVYSYKKWSFAIGAELPMVDVTTDAVKNELVNQRVPVVPLYVQYEWVKGSHVRLSGMLRNMQYRDLVADRNHNVLGWGLQLTTVAKVVDPLTLYFQGVYGFGISNFIQDLNGLGLDMIPDKDGKMKSVKAWGGLVGATYQFTDKVSSNVVFSTVRDYANYPSSSDTYKYAFYALGNIFYNVLPNLQVGAEYIWGQRRNFDHDGNSDNRIQAAMQFTF